MPDPVNGQFVRYGMRGEFVPDATNNKTQKLVYVLRDPADRGDTAVDCFARARVSLFTALEDLEGHEGVVETHHIVNAVAMIKEAMDIIDLAREV